MAPYSPNRGMVCHNAFAAGMNEVKYDFRSTGERAAPLRRRRSPTRDRGDAYNVAPQKDGHEVVRQEGIRIPSLRHRDRSVCGIPRPYDPLPRALLRGFTSDARGRIFLRLCGDALL